MFEFLRRKPIETRDVPLNAPSGEPRARSSRNRLFGSALLMRGTKPHLVVDNSAVVRAPATPPCLSKDAKAEWRRIMPALVKRKILTTADLGSVEHYCIATGRVREIERQIQAAAGEIDPKLFRMQDKAMQTARQLAAELGLTPVSRSRPAMRDESDDDDLAGLDL